MRLRAVAVRICIFAGWLNAALGRVVGLRFLGRAFRCWRRRALGVSMITATVEKYPSPRKQARSAHFATERAPQVRLGSGLDFNLLQLLRRRPSVQAAVLLGTVPVLFGAGPVLISIVLVVFMALAGFLIVRCSTPLSK